MPEPERKDGQPNDVDHDWGISDVINLLVWRDLAKDDADIKPPETPVSTDPITPES